MRRRYRVFFPLVLVLLPLVATQASAGMILTTPFASQGYTLSTFAYNFTNAIGVGPEGIGFAGNSVLVSDYVDGNIYLFPSHANGQNASTVPIGPTNYGWFNATDIAQVGGSFYMGTKFGYVDQISSTGQFLGTVGPLLGGIQDVRTNPATGHLIVSDQGAAIYDLDPKTGNAHSLIYTPGYIDGLTLSANGKTIYVADTTYQGIDVIDANTGAFLGQFAVGQIPGIDGLALGSGNLAGKLFANTNYGSVYEVDLANPNTATLVAYGGSRGDFVSVDPLNHTLLLTQTDSILRLTAPVGGGFGAVPEPASLTLLGIGALALCAYAYRIWKTRERACGGQAFLECEEFSPL